MDASKREEFKRATQPTSQTFRALYLRFYTMFSTLRFRTGCDAPRLVRSTHRTPLRVLCKSKGSKAANNRSNQLNPNNPAYRGRAGYSGTGTKADLDQHGQQLNPNNPQYKRGKVKLHVKNHWDKTLYVVVHYKPTNSTNYKTDGWIDVEPDEKACVAETMAGEDVYLYAEDDEGDNWWGSHNYSVKFKGDDLEWEKIRMSQTYTYGLTENNVR